MSKYPLILCFIIYLVSHYVQVLHLFTFHYIFSVPFWASTLQLYVSLFLQYPIMCKFPNFLCFLIYLVSHYVQVPYLFTFYYIFSFPFLCASSLLLIHFILLVSHSGKVPYSSTFHYMQCPIMSKFSIFLHFILSLVSHFVQVPYLFTFHQIFSVPFWASSLSIYISLYLQCPIWGKFPIYLHSIRSSVSHYVQVLHIFTFHSIFSVPFCASSLTSYVSLYLQCPILGKYPIILCFIIYLVSHYVQVPYLFTFHYFLCVPLCASSLFLHSIISLVSHLGQVPYLFTFHQIFSVTFGASSLSIYIPLDLQCPIMCKFSILLHSIIYLVSHFGQVPYLFTFHQIFSVPLCASSPFFSISLYLQCPILGKFPIYLHSIRSSVSHLGQVPYLFTFHQIFSVPLCASSPSFYISLYLQCPILGKFPNFYVSLFSVILGKYFLCFSVPFWASTLQLFTFHYFFSVPLCASSPSFYISLFSVYVFPNLCFLIYLVSCYVQVPYFPYISLYF